MATDTASRLRPPAGALAVGVTLGLAAGAVIIPFSTILSIPLAVAVTVSVLVVARPVLGLFLFVPATMLTTAISIGQLPVTGLEIRIEDWLIVCMLLGLTKRAVQGRDVTVHRLIIPITAYIGVSTIAAVRGMLVFDLNALQSLLYLLKYAEYFVTFILVVALVDSRRRLRQLVVVFLAIAAFAALWGVLESLLHFTTDLQFWDGNGRPRFDGPYEGVTEYGAFVGTVIPVALAFSISHELSRPVLSRLAQLCCVLTFIALLVSQARAPLVGAVVGVNTVVFLPVLFDRDSSYISRHQAVALFFGFVVVLTLIVLAGTIGDVAALERIAGFLADPTSHSGISHRLERWGSFLRTEFRVNPLFGAGIAITAWYSNFYIRVLVEQGIFAFLAFGWLIRDLLAHLYIAETQTNGFEAQLALGGFASALAFTIMNLTADMFIVMRTAQPFWFLMGLALVIPRINTEVSQ